MIVMVMTKDGIYDSDILWWYIEDGISIKMGLVLMVLVIMMVVVMIYHIWVMMVFMIMMVV